MRRTQRDTVIAVCPVAPARAIPGQDERPRSVGRSSGRGLLVGKAEHGMDLGEATWNVGRGVALVPERALRMSAGSQPDKSLSAFFNSAFSSRWPN
jgi:hypothetical protein